MLWRPAPGKRTASLSEEKNVAMATDLQPRRELLYRNQKLLEAVRSSPCQHCGVNDGTVVAAHSNQLIDGKGRGLKAHDYRIAALCYRCHAELDQGSKMSKQERVNMFNEAHRATIGWLFENGRLEVK